MTVFVSRNLGMIAVTFFCTAIATGSLALAQSRVANVEGNYIGVFANGGTGRMTTALLPFIEQDGRLVTGQLQNAELGLLDSFGVLLPNDKCTLLSTGGNTVSVYKAEWSGLGDGAGSLTGPISVTSRTQNVAGSLVLLRPFLGGDAGRPSISGEYSGLGVNSAIYMKYGDIVSRDLQIALTAGRTTSNYSAAFDVSTSGRIVGVGVQANGDIIHLDGQIQDGTSNALQLNISVTNSTGKLIHADSIIAILIG